MNLIDVLRLLKEDAAFVHGFKRGIGVILLSWLISYVVSCVAYPLVKVIVDNSPI